MTTPKRRLASVDALRGFDMFWIIGGENLFLPLFSLTGWALFSLGDAQMQHSAWHGFRFYDLIFPLFIFLSGVTLGIGGKSLRGEPMAKRAPFYRRAMQRLLLLIALGIVYNHGWGTGIPTDPGDIRYASVLARIGFAWFFAAMIVWHCTPRAQYLIAGAILLGYWLLQTLFGDMTPEGSLNTWVDNCCLPGLTFQNRAYDPEGLLSTLPAVANALAGVFAGRWLRQRQGQHKPILLGLAAAGVSCFVLAFVWQWAYPINKDLWTGTFVLTTTGWSLMLLALFYLLVDVWPLRRFGTFFSIIGCNAILVYLGTSLINWRYTSESLLGGIAAGLPQAPSQLLLISGVILLQWLILYWLYRRSIYISP